MLLSTQEYKMDTSESRVVLLRWSTVQEITNNPQSFIPIKPDKNTGLMSHIGSGQTVRSCVIRTAIRLRNADKNFASAVIGLTVVQKLVVQNKLC